MTPTDPQIRRLSEELLVDLEHECLIHRGRPLELGGLRCVLIKFLYNHWPGRYHAVQLIEALWKGAVVGENSVHQLVRRIHLQFEAWKILDQIDIEGTHAGYRLVLPQRPGGAE